MTAATSAAHTLLPQLAPQRAERQSQWVEALNNRLLGDLTLRADAAMAANGDGKGPWILFAADAGAGCAVKPLLIDGAIPALTDGFGRPDAVLAAAAMGEIEQIIAAIERLGGTRLSPVELVDAPPAGLRMTVEASRGERIVHQLVVTLPDSLAVAGPALPVDPAIAAGTIPRVLAYVTGPAVARAALSRIAPGDLLLLGTGVPLARFAIAGHGAASARVDSQGGVMVVEQVLDDVAAASDAEVQWSSPDELPIPTTVEIDATGLTSERLATLAPGSVVPILAASGGVLPVRLRAAGQPIANGELIAVGDGYGVLVTDRTTGALGGR